jgi:hypothetical protein
MITLNTVFQRYGPGYRANPPHMMAPQQRRVMLAIERCRTEALGGQVFTCPSCQTVRYSYHSCRNRHCPTCQHDAGQAWLAEQQACLLPVPYFLVTFTVPAELRAVARANQRTIYNALFRTSAAALQQLAADPRFLGGQLGMLGVLHTWTRDLRYHPHIHYLVPAMALTPAGRVVQPPAADFLVPVRPLAILFRAKLRASLRQYPFAADIPPAVWQRPWVVDCRPVGTGETALKYLAPYVFRVALSNNRILAADHDQVTFRYRHSASGENRTSTLSAATFIQRFLAHVLPPGFVKVRYYGLFSPGRRATLVHIRVQLAWHRRSDLASASVPFATHERAHDLTTCPRCGMIMHRQVLPAQPGRAPPVRTVLTA